MTRRILRMEKLERRELLAADVWSGVAGDALLAQEAVQAQESCEGPVQQQTQTQLKLQAASGLRFIPILSPPLRREITG